ncbi:MAG TPA: LysM peptidoglycan-binding domain-containing protein [Chthoniobacteraceae bacterium]|nr:LysM peptidoglycan-binding domain-containing protein [Chthoniobacteraceae bacterium]
MNASLSTSRRLVVLLLLLLPLLGGCEQIFLKGSERKHKEARARLELGDNEGAALLYEAALDGTPNSAQIHYQLGLLYDDKLKKPFSAIHHFQRYLDLEPEGRHAGDVRNFIKQDQLKLASLHGQGATIPQHEAVRLKNENLDLRKQLLTLRKELDNAVQDRIAALKKAGLIDSKSQYQKALIPGIRTYTVVSGDTLASISSRFYKTPERWRDIQDVNFNITSGTAKLKPGMVLMIP